MRFAQWVHTHQKSTPESIPDSLWRPTLLSHKNPQDREQLQTLLDQEQFLFFHDTLHAQLRQLIKEQQPSRKWNDAALNRAVQSHLEGCDPLDYGMWIYYPWSRRLVHLLPQQEYQFLRSARNRYKLTAQEQEALGQKSIGVVGMSVGQTIALTMVTESICGEIRIADNDTLELSNLNRLRASTHDLGTNKTVLAARLIAELDPYLRVTPFFDGLHFDNLATFLEGDGETLPALDLVLDECDSMAMKVALRQRARQAQIPLLMSTDDRGLVDIERFDLEPERPLLHGTLEGIDPHHVATLNRDEKLPLVLRVLGADQLSTRLVTSMLEIDHSVRSYPQLASEVTLGGALATEAARRILLNQCTVSGRFYFDLDHLFQHPPTATDTTTSQSTETRTHTQVPGQRPPIFGWVPESIHPHTQAPTDIGTTATTDPEPLVMLPRQPQPMHRDLMRRLVRYGITAPSGGNLQPWRFVAHTTHMECHLDRAHVNEILDYACRSSYLAIGSAVENIRLAAAGMGFATEVETQTMQDEHTDLVCRLHFTPTAGSLHGDDEAYLAQIPQRQTNRSKTSRQALKPKHRNALENVAQNAGARLQILTETDALDELADLLGACDRMTIMTQATHRELIHELRWNDAHAQRTRNGLDLSALQLDQTQEAAFRLLSRWEPLAFLAELDGGGAFYKMARQNVEPAAAFGLLHIPGHSALNYWQGGIAVQRVWLEATRHQLAIWPMTGLPYLLARLQRGDGEGLSSWQRTQLASLQPRFQQLYPHPNDHAALLLFRIAYAPPTPQRSLRRFVDDVLHFAPEDQ